MTHNKLSTVRRLAAALVLGNLAVIAILGLVLPQPALALLPVIALTLPLLTAARIEQALRHEPPKAVSRKAAPTVRAPRVGQALHHAA